MRSTVHRALEIWAKVVLAIGGVGLIIAIPGPFVMREMEVSFENVGGWILFGILSVGWWGFIAFVTGAIPVALGAALWSMRSKSKADHHAV